MRSFLFAPSPGLRRSSLPGVIHSMPLHGTFGGNNALNSPCRGNRLVAPGKRPSGASPGVAGEVWNGRICKGSAKKEIGYAPDQQTSGKDKRRINTQIMNSRQVH